MMFFPKIRRSTHAMKRLYNKIFRFYGYFEKTLDPKIDAIVKKRIEIIPNISSQTAIEYACGSGLLSLKLAPLFKSVTSRDLSVKMLERAKERAKRTGCFVQFSEGNILSINEHEKSYDYAFVSCALHLFSPSIEEDILKNLCKIARKAVIIIDHGKKWKAGTAVVEWFEGSYYDKFIKTDFKAIAGRIGCKSFEEDQIEDFTVLLFFV